MLNPEEIQIMKKNAKIHKLIFDKIKKIAKHGVSVKTINTLCGEIAETHGVICGFKGLYNFPYNICISINNVVAHGKPKEGTRLKNGDLVTFDFGIKDKEKGINTDAAFSIIIGGYSENPIGGMLIETNKKALQEGIKAAKVGNHIGDISSAIQNEIEGAGYYVVKELTGHAIGKKVHEKPYIPNYGIPGTEAKLKKGMTLAIEPILGQTTGDIIDKDGELCIADGSLGCQYEHTILITDSEAEIII